MARARIYTKRVKIMRPAVTSDGRGGTIDTGAPVEVAESWASWKTIRPDKRADYGLSNTINAAIVKLRYRSDVDYFEKGLYLIYNDVIYKIESVENEDERNRDIIIICTKSQAQ